MRYRIGPADASRTILDLRFPERPLVIIFLSLVALVCLLAGLAFAIGDESAASPADSLRAVCFIGFGLFSLCAIFLFSTGVVFPRRLLFDNSEGWLLIQDARGAAEGAIPYDGIAGFSVYRAVAGGIVRHSAGMDLRRGGRWELYASRSNEKARLFTQQLASKVRLQAQPKARPSGWAPFPSRPAADGSVLFEWQRQTRPGAMVISIVAIVSFAAALIGVRPLAGGPVAAAVSTGFALLLVAAAAAGILRTAGQRTVIEVGRGTVRWTRRGAFVRERSFTAAVGDIAMIDLSLTFSRAETAISLLRATEVELFGRYRQGTFGPGEVPGILSFLRALRRIDVSGLPPGRRLALAEALREAVVPAATRTPQAGATPDTPPRKASNTPPQ